MIKKPLRKYPKQYNKWFEKARFDHKYTKKRKKKQNTDLFRREGRFHINIQISEEERRRRALHTHMCVCIIITRYSTAKKRTL